jgi:NAD-dependent DNA ligase
MLFGLGLMLLGLFLEPLIKFIEVTVMLIEGLGEKEIESLFRCEGF